MSASSRVMRLSESSGRATLACLSLPSFVSLVSSLAQQLDIGVLVFICYYRWLVVSVYPLLDLYSV